MATVITFWKNSTVNFIGRCRGRRQHEPPPQWDPILSFSHMFPLKMVRVRGWRTPIGNPESATELCVLLTIINTETITIDDTVRAERHK